jgi:electron transfer flavoprotein alpha subunit
MSVFVILENRNGKITRNSLEAITAGLVLKMDAPSVQGVARTVSAIVVAPIAGAVLDELTGLGLDKIIVVEQPLLERYSADGYITALSQLIKSETPAYTVFPHSYQVRDFAPRLATSFGQVLISDVIALEPGPKFVRQLFQGRMNATYQPSSPGPCFVSVQAGAFRATAPSSGNAAAVETFVPELASTDIRTTAGEPFRASSQTVDLGSAQLIVGVGRGIKDAANIPLVQDLATALGAELAASRPICDAGWLPMERQVGSSGQTVAPKLYLAIGISGAIQHLVGIKGSQFIVAINKDPHAPILEIADYAIVGDLFEVVPALTAAIKAARQ